MKISEKTIANAARLHNEALMELSDSEVVQLVAEGRHSSWGEERNQVGDTSVEQRVFEVLSRHYMHGAGCACGPIPSLHPTFVTEYDWASHVTALVVEVLAADEVWEWKNQ